MDGHGDYHTKRSHTEKEKYHIWYIAGMNLQNRNRITDTENKLMVTRGEKDVGCINWKIGVDIYTLLYIK